MEEFRESTESYFSPSSWKKLGDKQQMNYIKQFYIYNACMNLGIDVVAPEFMVLQPSKIIESLRNDTETVFPCAFCKIPYGNSYERAKHELLCKKRFEYMSESQRKRYNCSDCSYTTDVKGHLNQHVYTHTKFKPFSCHLCGNGFTQKQSLQMHIKSIHLKEEVHSCPQCDFKTHYLTNLKMHLKTHSDEKKYICEFCGKGFHRKTNYNEHLFVHKGGEMPFKCQMCNKTFVNKQHMTYHMNTKHLNNKQFKCEECGFSSAQKGNLKSHMLTHQRNKPFKCSECSYQTVRKNELKNHLKKRHQIIMTDK